MLQVISQNLGLSYFFSLFINVKSTKSQYVHSFFWKFQELFQFTNFPHSTKYNFHGIFNQISFYLWFFIHRIEVSITSTQFDVMKFNLLRIWCFNPPPTLHMHTFFWGIDTNKDFFFSELNFHEFFIYFCFLNIYFAKKIISFKDFAWCRCVYSYKF